ncbi:hypothetical protein HWV62_6170 [Athelia sp. TMB]|nr:hypothetical protein HWV62_6170 [Athelia sp. TMB]
MPPANIIEENSVSFTHVLAGIASQPNEPFIVEAEDHQYQKKIWFKTEPITREFCYRVAQIQLWTNSQDQGYVDDRSAGTWSYFDVVILEDNNATEPRIKDGKELAWHSHGNRLGFNEPSTVFGVAFDRRRDLLDDLEPGNIIAVRACARFPGWQNIAWEGQLIAKVLKDDLFSPDSWTLAPVTKSLTADEATINNWIYTLSSTSDCDVEAKDNLLASKIWFTSPVMHCPTIYRSRTYLRLTQVLNADLIEHIQEVQLFTMAHNQGDVEFPEAGSWSWFDVMILNSREDTTPKVKNGRCLVWLSHSNPLTTAPEGSDSEPEEKSNVPRSGFIFDKDHELLCLLEPGNVIAVRVCAQFSGWENHAHSGRLVVRMSKNVDRTPRVVEDDLTPYLENKLKIEQALIDDFAAENSEAIISQHPEGLGGSVKMEPLRADQPTGKGEPPLRLLSLDGGGVRGVSTLSILKTIMAKVAGVTEEAAKDLKPSEYFDMIAGTSTGGLAISLQNVYHITDSSPSLIAIMLGRLHMTIGQVEAEYYDLASKVFKNNSTYSTGTAGSVFSGARYSAELFEQCIKDILKNKSEARDANVLLYEEKAKCKVFVTATPMDRVNNYPAVRLRSYMIDQHPPAYPDVKVWEAARATSAAPHYFKPMVINGDKLVDGGLKANNPARELLLEVIDCYGIQRPIECFLTIGTGIKPNVPIGEAKLTNAIAFVSGLIATATACEVTHQEAAKFVLTFDNRGDQGKYYRFNFASTDNWIEKVKNKFFPGSHEVTRVVQPGDYAGVVIGMDRWQDMKKFVELTEEYMQGQTLQVEKCASRLKV